MRKRVAILQSSYIPWKGYFDIINFVDEFILYDDVQFTKRDWRNRNRIKTKDGLIWLTIPVISKNKYFQSIRSTRISDTGWNRKHWSSITHNYAKSKHFSSYKEQFQDLYLGCSETYLSNINYRFLVAICKILGIETKISWSSDYRLVEGKTERLIDLCKQANATEYISGPAAKDYIDKNMFRDENITLRYMDYSGYPEYRQFHPPFVHEVSIIDLIFHGGPHATGFMKSFRNGSKEFTFEPKPNQRPVSTEHSLPDETP